MAQRWCDLLFAHWPVAAARLRPLVPAELDLDLCDGRGWVGVVPFRMEGVRFRGLPPLPGLGAFPELNVRTYVAHRGRPGVWFFSLDAASRLAVQVARAWFALPYYCAQMRCEPDVDASERGLGGQARGSGFADDGTSERGVAYASERRHRRQPRARLVARYAPTGPVDRARPGSLEHFLTERYLLYARSPRGRLFAGDVHHAPWPLQPARAAFEHEEVSRAAGLELDGEPLLHFARRLDVVVWPPRPVEAPAPATAARAALS